VPKIFTHLTRITELSFNYNYTVTNIIIIRNPINIMHNNMLFHFSYVFATWFCNSRDRIKIWTIIIINYTFSLTCISIAWFCNSRDRIKIWTIIIVFFHSLCISIAWFCNSRDRIKILTIIIILFHLPYIFNKILKLLGQI
jgi:hypothetical protein